MMNEMERFDFVIFLSVEWDDFFRRHLIKALARELFGRSKILCINRPICPVVTTITDRKKLFSWLKESFGSGHIRQETENLFIFTPFVFLHHWLASKFPFLVNMNRGFLSSQIEKILNKSDFRKKYLISLIYHPYQKDYIGVIKERLLIYDCYDEYSVSVGHVYSNKEQHKIHFDELKILEKAGIVLVASKRLLENKGRYHHNVHYVPNAADIEHFQLAQKEETSIAADISRIGHPIIGLLGNITERLDFNLIESIALKNPEWSIVFVGPIQGKRSFSNYNNLQKVKQLPNVYFLGRRPYSELPSYIKAFDVCIIPFTLSRFNLNSSPLRLYEYLAAGKPIVSTDLPEIQPFSEFVNIAKTPTDFSLAIQNLLESDGDNISIERLEVAEKNTWETRAAQIVRMIEMSLKKKDVKILSSPANQAMRRIIL